MVIKKSILCLISFVIALMLLVQNTVSAEEHYLRPTAFDQRVSFVRAHAVRILDNEDQGLCIDGDIEAVHSAYLFGLLDAMIERYIGFMTRQAILGSRVAANHRDAFHELQRGIVAMSDQRDRHDDSESMAGVSENIDDLVSHIGKYVGWTRMPKDSAAAFARERLAAEQRLETMVSEGRGIEEIRKKLYARIYSIPAARVLDAENQSLICFTLGVLPSDELLHFLKLDQLGITPAMLAATNSVFKALDLRQLDVSCRGFVKVWVFRRIARGQSEQTVLSTAQERLLPVIGLLETVGAIMSKNVPELTGMSVDDNEDFRRERFFAEDTLLHYFLMHPDGTYKDSMPTYIFTKLLIDMLTDFDKPLIGFREHRGQGYLQPFRGVQISGDLGKWPSSQIAIAGFFSNDARVVADIAGDFPVDYPHDPVMRCFAVPYSFCIPSVGGPLEELYTTITDMPYLFAVTGDGVRIPLYPSGFKRATLLAATFYSYSIPSAKRTEKQKLMARKYDEFLDLVRAFYRDVGFEPHEIADMVTAETQPTEFGTGTDYWHYRDQLVANIRDRIFQHAGEMIERLPGESDDDYTRRAVSTYLNRQVRFRERMMEYLDELEDTCYSDYPAAIRRLLVRLYNEGPEALTDVEIKTVTGELCEALFSMTDGGKDETRVSAATCLGAIGGEQARNALLALRGDSSEAVRIAVAEALEKLTSLQSRVSGGGGNATATGNFSGLLHAADIAVLEAI